MLLKGKKALVTGGTAGIGEAIALLFAAEGAEVCIWGTNEQRAEGVVRQMGSGEYRLVDVSKTDEVEAAAQELGQVNILVNNAGITRDGLLMKMSEADWDLVLDVNLKSVYNTCKALIRPMMKARSGKVINITSIVGLMGNPGQTNYAASKAGMIGFTKALAKEVASRGIQVNCIAPGYIETNMTTGLTPEVQETLLSHIPLGRMGQPREIAQAALFLASSLSDYITGQTLAVDGGMVMQ